MKNSYLYTILFMLVLSILLSGILALTDAHYKPVIETNRALDEKTALLDAFGLDTSGSTEEVDARFSQYVSSVGDEGETLYARLDDNGQIDSYAVPFAGAGLWGTIRGYLAVSADLQTVVGVVFTEQNETPGLGGRIDETLFRDQFRGLDIGSDPTLAYGAPGGDRLDAITGATSTSKAVLTILNELISQTLPQMEVLS